MKMFQECLACFKKQAKQVVEMSGCSLTVQNAIMSEVDAIINLSDRNASPPENVMALYSFISEKTGKPDPYEEIKKKSNASAMKVLSQVREKVSMADDPVMAMLKYTIAGNIIDYGAVPENEMDGALKTCLENPFQVDHSKEFIHRIEALENASSVVYLLDNCGEIVYDNLLLEHIQKSGADISLVVRGGPIINDATREDVFAVGLDRFGRVIDSGVACPGTPLTKCTDQVKEMIEEADLVVSKGQGNFETLSELTGNIVFLLTVKCKAVAEYIQAMEGGLASSDLKGKGELAVICR